MQIRSRAISPGTPCKLGSLNFPDGFVLVVDTREQRPLCMSVEGLTVCRAALKDGDYSIKGFEDRFAVERKQVSDFYSYIGRERQRTVKKLERLQSFDFAALVVESSLDDLLIPPIYTQVSAESARQFLISLNVRYGIHLFCDRRRENLERWILDRAIKFYNVQREVR